MSEPAPLFLQSGLVLVSLAIATALLAKLYQFGWEKGLRNRSVPTGFGVLLAPFCLFSLSIFSGGSPLVQPLTALAAFSMVYWWDDYQGLAPAWRILLCFLAGSYLAFFLSAGEKDIGSWSFLLKILFGGGLLVLITNVVNFSDGADGNLALWILLVGATGIAFGESEKKNLWIFGSLLAFAAGFASVNLRPKNIYLGDSGAFAFAGILVFLALTKVDPTCFEFPPEIFLTAALPFFDFLWVLFCRWQRGENLLQRHYEHLYQKIQIQKGGHYYLLPQVCNLGLCLLAGMGLARTGLPFGWSGFLAAVAITPVVYFFFRQSLIQNRGARRDAV